jgi:hypothetical protein
MGLPSQSKPSVLRASLSARPIGVEASGHIFTLPAASAAVWITALCEEDPITAVFPGLLSDDSYERATRMISAGQMPMRAVKRAAFDAITRASGRRWWEAIRLVGMSDDDGYVVGELTLRGVDPWAMPFARWCAAVYALATRGLEPKDHMKWTTKLAAPPPIEEAMAEADESAGSFEDMIRGFQSMPGARMG